MPPDDSREAITTPRRPEEWPQAFVARLNAGDLDGAAALYEEDARFVAPSGEILVGRTAIREVLAELIAAQTRFGFRVVRCVTAGEVAVLYTDFDGEREDPSGEPIAINSCAIEVLRRQVDGGWKLIVGDPNGRG